MPRAIGSKDYSTLVNGLITEASEIAFPDGATVDELNFLMDSAGIKRVKRKGLEDVQFDLSEEFLDFGDGFTAYLSSIEYWERPHLLICVIRASNAVGIDDTVAIIEFRDPDTLALKGNQLLVITDTLEQGESSIATLEDYAIIVPAPSPNQIICEYDQSANTIVVSDFEGYVRDFELVPDNSAISDRPSSLVDNHEYNLLNAGWYYPRRSVTDEAFTNPITDFYSQSGNAEYPSNADLVTVGLFENANGNEVFDRDKVLEVALGNSEAPRGHFIYALTDTDREARRVDPTDDGAPGTTLTNTIGTIPL